VPDIFESLGCIDAGDVEEDFFATSIEKVLVLRWNMVKEGEFSGRCRGIDEAGEMAGVEMQRE
jgi:hypothetical protein